MYAWAVVEAECGQCCLSAAVKTRKPTFAHIAYGGPVCVYARVPNVAGGAAPRIS